MIRYSAWLVPLAIIYLLYGAMLPIYTELVRALNAALTGATV